MILLDYTIKNFDWNVRVIYCDGDFSYRSIGSILENLGCKEEIIEDALYYCDRCLHDCGFTYTNTTERETVIVIFKCTSLAELYNTCVHELYHFIRQLSVVEYSSEEDLAELIGNMFMKLLNELKDLI